MRFRFLLFLSVLFLGFGQMAWGQIYLHNFGTTTINSHPYTVAPNTFDPNLSNSSWTNSTGSWTSYGGSSGQAISLANSNGTPNITLTFNVANGYQLEVTSFNFWRQRSNSGAQNWSMTINGISVGSGTIPTSGALIGQTNTTNTVSGLTGQITVVISLSGASGTGTFRLDDFRLNGSLSSTCTPPTNPNGTISGTTPACGTTSLTYAHGSGQPETDITYYWQISASGTSTDNNASTPLSVTASGTYFVRAYNSVTECWSSASTSGYPVVINTAPSITTQPNTSDLETCSGINFSPSSVSVSATGTGLSYQWYRNTTASNTGGTAISGATSSSYTIPNNITGTYYYYVVVTGAAPCSAVTSNVSGARTVNDLPATPTGLASNSPQCAPGGVTLSYSGTPEPNVTWYWQTTANGTSTANSTPTYNAATTGTYYLRPRNTVTGCWGSSASIAVTVNPAVTGISSNPSPTNNNTNVCYAGDGAFTGLTWNSVSQANSYDVYFGAGSLPSTPTTTVTATSYNPGTLLPSTTYYWKIVPKNDCGETTGTPIEWSFTTKSEICYCTPTTSNVPGDRIDLFEIEGITSLLYTSTFTSSGGYGDKYDTHSVTQSAGEVLTFLESYVTNSGTPENHGFNIWVDWNKDGDFADAGENVFAGGTITDEGFVDDFTVPALTPSGEYRMRIRAQYNTANPNSCGNVNWGEALDFKLIVTPACTPPADPVGSISGDTETCSATSLTYSGADVANAYWQTSPTGVNMSLPAGTPYAVPTTPGTYTVYVRIHDGTCWSANVVEHTIEVFAEPIILTQPSNISITVGNTATFTANITGATSYQWYLSTNGGANWSTLTGQTSDTYTTPTATSSMNGYQYRVAAFNDCGEITSSNAFLAVNDGPCFEEDFSNLTGIATGTNYNSGSYTNNGITWDYGGAQNSAPDYTIDGQGILLRRASDSFLEATIPAGVGAFSFEYRKAYTGNNLRQLELLVNGISVATSATFGDSPSGEDPTVYTFSHTLNTTEPVVIRIKLTGDSSTNRHVTIDNISWTCYADPCEAPEITLSPISGPVGAVVTITGTDFSETTGVNFDGIAAAVTYFDATTLEAVVPEGAITGTVTVDTDLDCDSEAEFTVTENDLSDCEGAVNIPGIPVGQGGLVFYELFDKEVANSGLLVILNASYSNIDLNDYQIARSSNGTGSDEVSDWHVFNPMILAPGEVYVLGTGNTTLCSYPVMNGTTSYMTGINENDRIRILRKSNLSIVDEVRTPNYAGYYMKRNSGAALLPNLTHDAGDWTTIPISGSDCQSGMAVSPIASGNPDFPTISNFQLDYIDCETTSISVTAAPGDTAHTLTYQWYVHTPETDNWTLISNGGIYSGATTSTLNINSATSIEKNQYYVRVMEGGVNCFVPSNAVQIRKANIWDGFTWSNGSPETANMQIIFAGDYDSSTDLYPLNGIIGCSIEVKDGVNVFIASEHNVIIDNEILVAPTGSFTLRNDANLLQINDVVSNEGDIIVENEFRFSPERNQYNFVNSPVIGQNIKQIYDGNPKAQYYNEPTNTFVFFDGTYQIGRSQALREPDNTFYDGQPIVTAEFTGEPFNGTLTLSGLTNGNTGFHLIGNPYPSNLDLIELYADNEDLEPRFLFWDNRGNTQIDQYGDGYNGDHYARFNAASPPGMGTGTPASGTTDETEQFIPNGKVAVGSAVMARLKESVSIGTVILNNSQRTTQQGVNFFGKANMTTEVDRYWLTMETPNGLNITNAIVYFEGGDDEYAEDDSKTSNASDNIYSVVGANRLAIQGKSAFVVSDTINLGYRAFETGVYKIKLLKKEGVFENGQNIYLIDRLTETTVNLTEEDLYLFETHDGQYNERFLIVYETEGTEEPEEPEEPMSNIDFDKYSLIVYKNGNETVIQSAEQELKNIKIFNLQGQILLNQSDLTGKIFSFGNDRFGKQTLLLKVRTADGVEHNFKVLTY